MRRLKGVRARTRRGALLGSLVGGLLAASLAGCGGVVGGCDGLLFAAACTHGPTAAPGGLSQEAAIAAARRQAPAASPDPSLVWAEIEPDPFAPPGSADRRLVWEVRLQGSSLTAPACPSGFLDRAASPSDPACLDGDGGLIVVLDYFSGAFLGWIH